MRLLLSGEAAARHEEGRLIEEYSVDFGGAKKAEMVERAGGRMTVPQIFIDGRHVGGCDDLMCA